MKSEAILGGVHMERQIIHVFPIDLRWWGQCMSTHHNLDWTTSISDIEKQWYFNFPDTN